MELKAGVDTSMAIEEAFAKVTDLDRLEAFAREKGVGVNRLAGEAGSLVGTKWFVTANFRGRMRDFELMVAQHTPPDYQSVTFVSGGLSGEIVTQVSANAEGGTHVDMKIILAAETLTGRLLLQSLKLGRGRIENQLKKRLTKFLTV